MRLSRISGLLAGLLAALGFVAPAAAAPRDCAALAGLEIDNVRIITAEAIPGGQRWDFPPSPFNVFLGPNAATENAFCRVAGVIEDEIRFEVWLPPEWNRRLLGVGNAGFTGGINYPAMSGGLARGFATASTDTGHQTPDNFFDASWIPGHPDRVENFGRRAHHLLAETAKMVVRAYYGRRPWRSYYEGCSSGGWQGLTEAQQYPSDYDGILAGAPANNFVRLQTRGFWLDALSRRNPAGDLGAAQIATINAAALAACDPADGVTDGIIGDPQACRFDPAALACTAGQTERCLTQDQIDRARLVYGPARTPAGTRLYPGNHWAVTPVVVIPGVQTEPALTLIVPASERGWTAATFDSDRDIPALEQRVGPTLDAYDPDLSRFQRAGGKLDRLMAGTIPARPWNSIAYHEAVEIELDARRSTTSIGCSWCRVRALLGGWDRTLRPARRPGRLSRTAAPRPGDRQRRDAAGATRTRPLVRIRSCAMTAREQRR